MITRKPQKVRLPRYILLVYCHVNRTMCLIQHRTSQTPTVSASEIQGSAKSKLGCESVRLAYSQVALFTITALACVVTVTCGPRTSFHLLTL